MNPIVALTIASAKMFIRSRQALFFSLFTPLIIMFIFGSTGFDKQQQISIGLAVHSPTLFTTQFIDQIKQISSFDVEQGTLEQERARLEQGKLSLLLDIPDDLIASHPPPGPRGL